MQNLAHRLEKRGWKRHEIEKAISIIRNAKGDKSNAILFLEKRIYWILLAVVIAANFAIAIALMPLLVGLRGLLLHFILIIVGLIFGLLFEVVIRSIEHLEDRHHFALAIIIPLTALINAFLITRMANNIASVLSINNSNNPYAVAIVYALAFVAPYFVSKFVLKKGYYKRD